MWPSTYTYRRKIRKNVGAERKIYCSNGQLDSWINEIRSQTSFITFLQVLLFYLVSTQIGRNRWVLTVLAATGCSSNIVFSKKFATSPRPLLLLLLAVQEWSTNKSDCPHGSLARMSCSSTCKGWVAVHCEKSQFLINTLYYRLSLIILPAEQLWVLVAEPRYHCLQPTEGTGWVT